jgi:hypothetical protein
MGIKNMKTNTKAFRNGERKLKTRLQVSGWEESSFRVSLHSTKRVFPVLHPYSKALLNKLAA